MSGINLVGLGISKVILHQRKGLKNKVFQKFCHSGFCFVSHLKFRILFQEFVKIDPNNSIVISVFYFFLVHFGGAIFFQCGRSCAYQSEQQRNSNHHQKIHINNNICSVKFVFCSYFVSLWVRPGSLRLVEGGQGGLLPAKSFCV